MRRLPGRTALSLGTRHHALIGNQLATLAFDSVKARSLADIWRGPAFDVYRGDAWMPEPCASCPRKAIDFGGCRCQAFLMTGDAARTDPVCSLSPDHALARIRPPRSPPPEVRAMSRPPAGFDF